MAFVDIDATPIGDVVIIRAGNLYMQYNRKRGFNEGTRQFGNRVVIVSAKDYLSVSQLEAGLAIGISGASKRFAYPNFDDTGYDLVIEVCDQVYGPPDYVRISIHLANGIQSSQCAFTLPALTGAPTLAPTPAPTLAPTTSVQPSNAPTQSPSDQPSQTPTQSPTTSPTTPAPTLPCRDQEGLVRVSNRLGGRTCQWVAAQKEWKAYLCREGYEAYEQCKITCNSCNAKKTKTEPDNQVPLTCEDSTKLFFLNEKIGGRPCSWLARNPGWQSQLCVPDEDAYHTCPETCGKCTDDCEDTHGKSFYVNRKRGYQDCAWLSEHREWLPVLCYPGHRAYHYCMESCDSCNR